MSLSATAVEVVRGDLTSERADETLEFWSSRGLHLDEGLMRSLNTAVWPRSGFMFIGETPQGTHVRVRYFEGARVPAP